MLSSVQLSVMMGPVLPAPVPRVMLDSLASVEVTVNDVGKSGFRLTFSVAKGSPLQTLFLLNGNSPILFMRVVLVATVNGVASVLMDGVITENHFSPGDKGSNSTMTVIGEDLTVLMDQSNPSGLPFPSAAADARVSSLLAKYSVYGVVAQVAATYMTDESSSTDLIPSQQGTDLQYITKLAQDVGYVFYLDPGPAPGSSRAYWGPQIKYGPVQPALTADMDAYTNVESLSFEFNQQQNRTPTVINYNDDKGNDTSLNIPQLTPINPQLGAVTPLPANTVGDLQPLRSDLAKRPVPQAIMLGMAAAAQWREAVTANGSLDVTRYGGVLKARQLVGLRGAGQAFDGLYYVKSVTHHIKRGEYKQDFQLSRDGLVSTVPVVTP